MTKRINTSYPNMAVEEIISLLAGEAGPDIVAIENAKRQEAYDLWQSASVDVEGGPLIVDAWYDVNPGGLHKRDRMWRQCRFVGRSTSRDYDWGTGEPVLREFYVFERWGANAGKDPYAGGRNEHVGVNAKDFSVHRIDPDPKVLAKIKERASRKF